MKQTNNAIKFLMAQYRAIFKNANLKMILAAAAAAGALSAGAANAAIGDVNLESSEWEQAFKDGNGTVTITGKDTDKGAAGKFQNITLAGSASTPNGGTKLELAKNQMLVVGDSEATTNVIKAGNANGDHIEITGEGTLKIAGTSKGETNTYGLTLDGATGSVKVQVDKVEVQSDLFMKTGADNNASVELLANSIVVGDGKFTAGADDKVEGLAYISLGDAAGSGNATLRAREITINKDGKITLAAISGTGTDFGTDLDGELLNVNGGILSFGSPAGGDDASARVNVGKININNGGILSVAKNVRGSLNPADGGEGIVNVNDGAHVVIGGTLGLYAGTMRVSEGATLAASDADGMLYIGDEKHDGDDIAVVELSSKKLASFLTGKVGTEALKYKDERKILDTDATNDLANAATGKVNLRSGGTIKLTDSANVDVAQFTYNNSSATAGQIFAEGGTLAGQNLTVSKKLTGADNLEVAAKNLTLGSTNLESGDSLGVGNFWAENVTFVKNKGGEDFSFKDSLSLENAGAGSITGHVDIDGGEIVIESGKYTANGNVILTSGFGSNHALYVQNAASALQVNGLFETTETDGKAVIEDGVLDLRNASELQVAQGTIELQDVAELYVDGSKFITKAGDAVTFDTAKFAEKAVTGDAMSTMHITGLGSLTMKQYEDLVTKTGFSGSFAGFDVTGSNASGSMTFDASKILAGTPDSVYGNTVMTVGADAIKKTYSFGAVKLAQSATKLTIGDTTDGVVKLTNANLSANGNFVETAAGNTGDVHLATEASGLKLVGTGKVGNITAAAIPGTPNTARERGLLLIGDAHKYGSANVTVTGNIGATDAILDGMMVAPGSSLTVNGDNIDLRHLYVTQGASLNAPKATITVTKKNGDTSAGGENYAEFEVLGSLTAKNLNLAYKADANDGGAHVVAGGATLKLSGELKIAKDVKLNIGSDDTNGLGAVVIADTLDMVLGGSIFVDPPYGKKASALIINKLTDNEVKGNLTVGQNAITAIGFADEASAMAVVADYLDANGSFNPDSSVKNALVINKPITVADGAKISLDPNGKTGSLAVNVAKGAGLIITDAALTDASGNKTQAAITVEGNNQKVSIDADTPVLLAGKFTAADKNLKLFSGSGNDFKLENEVKGQSVNGMLSFTVGTNGQVAEIKLDADKLQSQMAKTSGPVRDLVGKILGKDSANYVTSGLGYDYLHEMATTSVTGAEIDAVAHAATFAGAQVAAVAAVGTMAEAIGGRVGSMGVEAATIAATGSQASGGVWLTPAYKNVDADGFDAQGASYGADVDLTGVTFGADTVNGNMRFGAAFNIGSGDADGKGQGNGLKDEFDYYGVGIYSVMGFGSLAVVGDASFNVISHEVKGASGSKDFGDVSAKADTTAVTLGVTGQYTIATEFADITPHAGMRFTRLDTESYEMKTAKGSIGKTDFDVQNVFSIPVGVGVSKAFNMGDWTLAPNADLTLTFNTGDTEVNSSVRFDGVKVNTVLDTEVLDKVTYGLNLGLGAQNGNFGTSVSINYTGSSNTDSLGINANARFKF
ncbi:MAG: autotransporter outer membrane beta-barrel domain-containing protein [Anaerobiospirillum succiniciproducens]|uniref:autotransporter outer membrane beta-barrel domain-containing protein n=1 Tax=Anaerobiospirillum succiniciproducens TaxID=13335 RepID=UPI002A76415D|nr:autotransporter outer membrane beta-barrel domain-containing protein [Anaerobiospirillum succiniciproducens]MDY2798511.1 autotransporter outer membrane beta-barrel domain-containing protein [Anaerobiospirillum succiniciproducens]